MQNMFWYVFLHKNLILQVKLKLIYSEKINVRQSTILNDTRMWIDNELIDIHLYTVYIYLLQYFISFPRLLWISCCSQLHIIYSDTMV